MSNVEAEIEFKSSINRMKDELHRLQADLKMIRKDLAEQQVLLNKLQGYWEGIGK